MIRNEKTSAPKTAASSKWWQPYVTYVGSEEPSRFAESLARTVPTEPGTTKLLDIGCGCGIIGLYCLIEKKVHSVTFGDLRPDWITVTRANADLKIGEGLIKQSQVAYTEAVPFTRIRPEEISEQTLLVFNPPQLPTDYVDPDELRKIQADQVERDFRIAGPDGLGIAREFFDWYAHLKRPKPDAVILLSSFIGRKRISEAIDSCHINWEIVGDTPTPLRSLLEEAAGNMSAKERDDASLARDGDKWIKRLLTIRLTGDRGT